MLLLFVLNRDSGSKLKRLGLASVLKIGQPFPGVVLSSEASVCVSHMDLPIVEQHGISGINCSWNRYAGYCYSYFSGSSTLIDAYIDTKSADIR